MAIRKIIINVFDVARSAEFYRRFLGAELVGELTADRAVLDVVTATIELRHLAESATAPADGAPALDDLITGFKHVGFKVADVDSIVAELKAADVPFHLDPLEAEGDVRITFFYAPEGTLLELVARDLHYTVVHDADGVARERALGIPSRPRFDHVAMTVRDRPEIEEFYRPFGYTRIGTIEQPYDPRGFHIDYLQDEDSVLEVFTYDVPTTAPRVRLDGPGFVAAVLDAPAGGAPAGTSVLGEIDGALVASDVNGFPYALDPSAA